MSHGSAMSVAMCLLGTAAQAQTASQITPQSFRPTLERQGGFALPGTPGLATPLGAERLFVRLSGVSVRGGFAALADATKALEDKLTGRAVSGADVFAAARDLEAAYAKAGYVLVRVVLPPQQLNNGTRLKLTVVDGYIDRIETKDIPDRVRKRISQLLEPLIGRRSLMLADIERRVLLAGDTPGVVLRSTLSAGKAQGATTLVIDATYQAMSETLSSDNTLSRQLGRYVVGAGVDLNSVAGLGELVYLRASGHPDGGSDGFFEVYPRNRTLAAGVVIPLWIDGLSFNTEFTDARTTPRQDVAGAPSSTDTFERVSARLRYAWFRGRSGNFNTELALDAQEERLSLFVGPELVPFQLDRLRIVRFSQEGDVLTPWGATISGRATASFGLSGLGARSAADASVLLPLSRVGADASFQKFDVTLNYTHSLIEHLVLALSARAQTSFNAPLLRSEQFGIANGTGISALDAGTIVGDQGYVLRGELQSPWSLPVQGTIFDKSLAVVASPYVFGAYGETFLKAPQVGEFGAVHAGTFGAGLRLGGGATGTLSNGSLSLEYGFARRSAGTRADSERFTIVSAFRF